MAYTLGEAAKATGKSKATISKAIKSGRISASKGENGTFAIDPSELHRVYPANVENTNTLLHVVNSKDDGQIRELKASLDAAQERLVDKEAVVSDLREDRDRWRQQATALLEDKRRQGIWKKLFGK